MQPHASIVFVHNFPRYQSFRNLWNRNNNRNLKPFIQHQRSKHQFSRYRCIKLTHLSACVYESIYLWDYIYQFPSTSWKGESTVRLKQSAIPTLNWKWNKKELKRERWVKKTLVEGEKKIPIFIYPIIHSFMVSERKKLNLFHIWNSGCVEFLYEVSTYSCYLLIFLWPFFEEKYLRTDQNRGELLLIWLTLSLFKSSDAAWWATN